MFTAMLFLIALLFMVALYVHQSLLKKREREKAQKEKKKPLTTKKEKKKPLTTKEALERANILADKSRAMLISNIRALGPLTEKEKKIIEVLERKYKTPRPHL